MRFLSVFVCWVFTALSVKAQGEWIIENIDPITGLRTGVIRVNGNDYRIGPSADLSEADLSGADLSGADLRGASLVGSINVGTNFSGANLSGTILTENNVSGANFFGADLNNARIGSAQTGIVITSVSRGHSEEIQTLKTSVTTNTSEIEAIKAQLATLVDALAAKDAEIEERDERIAQLEAIGAEEVGALLIQERDAQIKTLNQRPTQAEFDAVVTERDERLTVEEVQDARTGSVIVTPDSEGNIQVQLGIEESSDLEVWSNEGKKLEALFPLAEGKKFLRFVLAPQN
ncbi:pentapeptide repeat-containing protein [Akkermansiaceae bacterium]|nr:pentapeptide repeat-containing protein [Akkermansiaceae bacterium]